MSHFPIFFEMKDRPVLVVGGGKTAFRRVNELHEAGAVLTVIAPEICEDIEAMSGITMIKREASADDVKEDFALAVIASSDSNTNEKIACECRKKRVFVNRSDHFQKGDFVCGKTVTSGDIVVSVFSGGVPEISQYISAKLEYMLTPELISMAGLLIELRPVIKKSTLRNVSVKEFIDSIVTTSNLRRIASEGIQELREEILSCL